MAGFNSAVFIVRSGQSLTIINIKHKELLALPQRMDDVDLEFVAVLLHLPHVSQVVLVSQAGGRVFP